MRELEREKMGRWIDWEREQIEEGVKEREENEKADGKRREGGNRR